jgi:hypothetical protein
MQTKRNSLIMSIMLIVLSLVAAVPTFAQGPNEFDEHWHFSELVHCANGGLGEWVDMTGTIHFVNANGIYHANLQNAVGVGQSTGDVYRAIGTLQELYIFGDGADIFGVIDDFRLIGPGPGNDLFLHFKIHATVNASGEPTAVTIEESFECR